MTKKEQSKIRKLALECINDALPKLTKINIKNKLITVYIPNGNGGSTSYSVQMPNFHNNDGRQYSAVNKKKSRKLSDFILSMECLSESFNETVLSNENAVHHIIIWYLILSPIFRSMEQYFVEKVISGESPVPWGFNKDDLDTWLDKSINHLCKFDKKAGVATGYIAIGIRIKDSINSVNISKDIQFEQWDNNKKCIFFTKYGDVIDGGIWSNNMVFHEKTWLSVDLSYEIDARHNNWKEYSFGIYSIRDSTFYYKVDLIKWAICVAKTGKVSYGESRSIIVDSLGDVRYVGQRASDSAAIGSCEMDASTTEEIASLIALFEKYHCSDLLHALWLFGRALLSRTEADRVLNCVIALEAILSTDERDAISYKVALRGSALLMNVKKYSSDVFKKIKNDLYGARSSTAHGNRRKTKIDPELSHRAVKILADIIHSVLMFYEQGRLSPATNKDSLTLANKIDNYILSTMKQQ